MSDREVGRPTLEQMFPHKGRALLLDRARIAEDGTIYGEHVVKAEDCEGHFPGNPIYPGHLRIEQIALTLGIGGADVLTEGQLPYLVGTGRTRFPSIARLGDLVIAEARIDRMTPRSIKGSGRAYVNGVLIAEVEDILCLIGK